MSEFLDLRTILTILVMAFVFAGRKVIMGAALRLLRRWNAIDALTDKRATKALTREERLELRVEEMVASQLSEAKAQYEARLNDQRLNFEARLNDAKVQIDLISRERDVYRHLALDGLGSSHEAHYAKRQLARYEMTKTNPGDGQVSPETLAELTSDVEDEEGG